MEQVFWIGGFKIFIQDMKKLEEGYKILCTMQTCYAFYRNYQPGVFFQAADVIYKL